MTSFKYVPEEKLLQICVQHMEGQADPTGISIRAYKFQDVIPAKTNNTSKVLKMRIHYDCEGHPATSMSVMVKIPFGKSLATYHKCKGWAFFDKEAVVYRSVLPRLHKLLGTKMAPIGYASDERQVLFLEDLSARGYSVRVDGPLDVEHSIATVRQLARFHAASYVLEQENPLAMGELVKKSFFVNKLHFDNILDDVTPFLRIFLPRVEVPHKSVVNFFNYLQQLAHQFESDVHDSRFPFEVLTHGDVKSHNVMFSYDDQSRVEDSRLIDFQGCCWSSPVRDVMMLAITSMDHHVYANHFQDILRMYLLALNGTLESLLHKPMFTESDFYADSTRLNSFKLFYLLFFTRTCIRVAINQLDYETKLVLNDDSVEVVYANHEFREKFLFWFYELEKWGAF